MSDNELTRPQLSRCGGAARCVGWLALIVVIATMIVPVSYSPQAAAVPTLVTLDDALEDHSYHWAFNTPGIARGEKNTG
jgi:hypothetical protein